MDRGATELASCAGITCEYYNKQCRQDNVIPNPARLHELHVPVTRYTAIRYTTRLTPEMGFRTADLLRLPIVVLFDIIVSEKIEYLWESAAVIGPLISLIGE